MGGIGPTLLIFLSTSGVGRIIVMDHDNVDVYNLHRQVIHTKGRRETRKARPTRNDIRFQNPTVLVTATTEPLTWDNAMEIARGNDCVVDTIDNTQTR